MKAALDKLIEDGGQVDGQKLQLLVNGQPVAGTLSQSGEFPGLYEVQGSGAITDPRTGAVVKEATMTCIFAPEAAALNRIEMREVTVIRPR